MPATCALTTISIRAYHAVSGQHRPLSGLYLDAENLWWRLDRALDEESLYYSGLICSLEAIRSGCTAVIDHHASPDYIAGSLSQLRQAFLKVGLRGMTCFETTDRNGGAKELQAGVEENIRFAREIDSAREKAIPRIWWRPISALMRRSLSRMRA